MKQIELADRAGLNSASDVSRIENGKWWPSEKKIRDIASALNCTIGELFEDSDYPKAEPTTAHTAGEPPPPAFLGKIEVQDVFVYAAGLNAVIAESHAANSRALQIVLFSLLGQLDGAKLLTALKANRDRVESETNPNKMLVTELNNLIAQIMRSAGGDV